MEYSIPAYVPVLSTSGCSMVRATKVPRGGNYLSHDSCCGAEPHNYFAISFGGGTWEQRTRTEDVSKRLPIIKYGEAEQRIFLIRYPILQTLLMNRDLFTKNAIILRILGIDLSTEKDCTHESVKDGKKWKTVCKEGTENYDDAGRQKSRPMQAPNR